MPQHPAALKTRLSGTVTVTHGSASVRTQSDLTSEVFRNDVVIIEGRVFRVSSEIEGHRFRGAGGGARRGGAGGGGRSGEWQL